MSQKKEQIKIAEMVGKIMALVALAFTFGAMIPIGMVVIAAGFEFGAWLVHFILP